MKYLLDTNICIFVIRQKPIAVLARFLRQPPGDVGISSITLAELRYGADKSSRPGQNHAALDAFVSPLSVAAFDARAADVYGKIRADLERRGTPIGPLDTLIAAHAVCLGIAVVTDNASEFSRVAGLKMENWASP